MANERRLKKSQYDKKLAGVCGGFAEYIGCDSTMVRLIYVCISLFTAGFPGLLVYLIACIIMPNE